jgi:16S rRNA (uracil1498-N3)-methyltransferase
VLRLQAGDRLILLNGEGQGWLAQLVGANEADLIEPYDLKAEFPIPVTLVAALPKNGFDEVVRCCTELGVTNIVPVISDRTILKPSDNKLRRWRKISAEAAEQSERAIVPTIFDPRSFQKVLSQLESGNHYICGAREMCSPLLMALPQALPSGITVWVGPEGGWTKGEIKQAIAAKIQPISLGNSILRAVTASIAAMSLVNGYLNTHEGN